jgi:tetratricopeptide (TPR) repeat protein
VANPAPWLLILACAAWAACGRADGDLEPTRAGRAVSPELAQRLEGASALVRADPKSAKARAELGLVFEANGLWREARECYDRAAELDAQEPLWPLHAALCSEELAEVEDAQRRFERAVERFPDCAPLRQRVAESCLTAGEFETARAHFEQLVALAPGSSEGWVGLGAARSKLGDHPGATEALERAVQLDPSYRLAHYLLGLEHRDAGRLEDAGRELALGREAYRRMLGDAWSDRLRSASVGVAPRFERALGLLKVGRLAEAAAALEELHAAHPDDVQTLGNLAITYARLGRQPEGLAILDRALELAPDSAQIHMTRASCLLSMGRATDALAAAERSVALGPAVAANHLVRGMVLRALRRDEEARTEFLEARRLDPGNADVERELAQMERH